MGNSLNLNEEPQWKAFVWRWLALSLVLHLVTAKFSIGHHSADEYFQILEFLSFKLGKTPAHHLPTEFREQMRPWLQPAIYWCMTRIWEFFGVFNPFTWATSFRVFSGLVGWVSTATLALCAKQWFQDHRARKLAVILLSVIWFFPVLHVRPSSESLAGSTFLIALCLTEVACRPDNRRSSLRIWMLIGALLGLSFEFRFQMGLMIFGLIFWVFALGSKGLHLSRRILTLSSLGLGLGVVFLLGRWVDHWGYGQWVLSPLNYYQFNLVRGEVSKYGTAPWWDVFRMSMTETWPILGFVLAVCTAVAWIRHPKHLLTWSQVPFFAVHEMIAHKELRFFFPIALAGPILVTLSLYSSKTHQLLAWPVNTAKARLARLTVGFLALNNFAALVGAMFMPFARTVQFYQGVYHQIPAHIQNFDLYFRDRDPYILLGNPVFFYRPLELKLHRFGTYSDLREDILNKSQPVWLFDPGLRLPPEAEPIRPYCQVVYQTLSPKLELINWGNWMQRTLTWSLYRCKYR